MGADCVIRLCSLRKVGETGQRSDTVQPSSIMMCHVMMLQATDSISGVYGIGTTLLSWRRCVRHFSHMGTAFLAGAVSQRGPPQVNTMIAVQDRCGTFAEHFRSLPH